MGDEGILANISCFNMRHLTPVPKHILKNHNMISNTLRRKGPFNSLFSPCVLKTLFYLWEMTRQSYKDQESQV